MEQVILILHVLVAVAIISLVLMQHGRGADVGASFGSGSSNTMFGSVGALPFLMKITAVCAAVFFATSLSLSYLATRDVKQSAVLDMPAISQPLKPATPVKKKKAAADEAAGLNFAPQAAIAPSKKAATKKD